MNTILNSQGMNDGFGLIWYYWFRKYMCKKGKKPTPPQQLLSLKKKYHIEAIQSTPSTSTNLPQKLSSLSQKSPPQIYTINPASESSEIEQLLHSQASNSNNNKNGSNNDAQQTKDLINELHSYYLNSNNIYIIYRQEKEDLILQPLSKIINEDDSLGERNDSIVDSYHERVENRIQHLEILDRVGEFDGVQIWNAKYMNIPHSFVKTKKMSWARGLNRAISHPCQPRTMHELPIIPRITLYQPSPEKLLPFISFMKMLQDITPDTHSLPTPTIDSIFQYNKMPYIFVQDCKEESIAVLCYYVVYGDGEGQLSEGLVERWMKENPDSVLTRVIKEMQERYRNRNRYNKDGVSRGLGLLTGQDTHGNQIW